MSYITYNNKRIIPAPLVRFNKQVQTSDDAEKISTQYDINILGTLVAEKGSPNSSGVFHTGAGYPTDENIPSNERLSALFNKQQALRDLFSADGLELKWAPVSGTPIYCFPRIRGIDFAEDIWYETCDYTISCDADIIYGLSSLDDERFSQYISSAEESWELQDAEVPGTYNVSHTISAVGKRFYNSGVLSLEAYQQAKNYVQTRLGFDASQFLGSVGSLGQYQHRRTENVDILGGAYSITETWLLSDSSAVEDYTIQITHDGVEPNRYKTATIEGTIRGNYATLGDFGAAYTNALASWTAIKPTLLGRLSGFGNFNYVSSNITHDSVNGVISYSYQYDTRPRTSDTIEEYTINYQLQTESYRSVVGINGRITGTLDDDEDDTSDKYDRAALRWAAVQPLLFTRAQTTIPSLTQEIILRKDENHNITGGFIEYNYEYDARTNLVNNTIEEYDVSRDFEYTDYRSLIRVNGRIMGIDPTPSGAYSYASTQWAVVEPNLYTRATTYFPGVSNLRTSPIRKTVSHDPTGGSIEYIYEFNNRDIDAASDEYSVSSRYNVEQGFHVISIGGTVQGYDLDDDGEILNRYNNALSAMPSDSEIYGRAVSYATGITFDNFVRGKEITHSPQAGSISYQFEFSTQPQPCFVGALSESITISDVIQGDVFAAIPIPGRTDGPLFQDMNTKTPKQRRLTIELVFPPTTGCGISTGLAAKPNVSSYISEAKPSGTYVFSEPGSEAWDWRLGRYFLDKSWVYGD